MKKNECQDLICQTKELIHNLISNGDPMKILSSRMTSLEVGFVKMYLPGVCRMQQETEVFKAKDDRAASFSHTIIVQKIFR